MCLHAVFGLTHVGVGTLLPEELRLKTRPVDGSEWCSGGNRHVLTKADHWFQRIQI